MKFISVATEHAVTVKAIISSAAIDVVHPVNVDDLTALPVLNAGLADAVIVLPEAGKLVPLATFQTSIVHVGFVPSATILQAVIVPAFGILK